jgi:hypothetical protein
MKKRGKVQSGDPGQRQLERDLELAYLRTTSIVIWPWHFEELSLAQVL